ncbi:PHOCN-like protein [Mya arenaria]|uniref:PHOCN-like protein n=1 Tax=Mya arenaria TaxID=6604 RepID=A0ABY7D9L4_MYAAR|nr:PHOCN-like protein [Mya arenaria]
MKMAKIESEDSIIRRNRPGTKSQAWCSWPDESFEEMDSTLAVQQFIQQLIARDASRVDEILTPPEGQDEGVWKYEHLRQFCMELNGIAVKLQTECNPETCTQMTATEQWIFLCAAHKTPKENETSLCKRFTVFVTKYELMSKDNLIVPILEDQQSLQTENIPFIKIVKETTLNLKRNLAAAFVCFKAVSDHS